MSTRDEHAPVSAVAMAIDYGDAVELTDPTDIARFGILKGSVCGFRVLDAAHAMRVRVPKGTLLVLVEAENGASVEIPRDRLKKLA